MRETIKRLGEFTEKIIARRLDMVFSAFLLFVLFLFLAMGTRRGIEPDLKKGDIMPYDMFLPQDVDIIDQARMDDRNEKIRQDVIPVFVKDRNIRQVVLQEADAFFTEAEQVSKNENLSESEKATEIFSLNTNLSRKDVSLFMARKDLRDLGQKVHIAMGKIYDKGYLHLYDVFSAHSLNLIEISDKETGSSGQFGIEEFYSPENLEVTSIITQNWPGLDSLRVRLVKDSVLSFLKPDINYDIQRTAQKIDDQIKRSEPVYKSLKKGKVILYKGEEITKEKIGLVREINRRIKQGSLPELIAVMLTFMSLFGFVYLALRFYEPRVLKARNYFYLLLVLSAVSYLAIYLVGLLDTAYSFNVPRTLVVPIVLAALTFPVFFGLNFSLIIIATLTLFSGFILKSDFINYIFILLTGSGAAILGQKLKRRDHFWILGLLVIGMSAVFSVTDGMLNFFSWKQILRCAVINSAVTLISVIVALGIIPLFELAFNALTDSRLLELSDLNKPIFKRMLMEAPGTYHHSILTANLVEAAALETGANSLLVKVAAYYHDIGKISHPEFYIENSSAVKMEEIKPSLYVSIVRQHLKESVDMGRKLRLPNEVLDLVAQHHGKGLIKFFYFKALNSAREKDKNALRKEDFIYSGENPKTREAVILMLADSVEAASRSLANPSFARIKELAEEIVNSKFAEGLLGESDITLGEIKKIGEAFIKVLVGVFHTRVKYPDDEAIRNAEQVI